MDTVASGLSLTSEPAEKICYVVTRSALLQNRVFCLGEVREMPDFGHHFHRLIDCGHVRSVDLNHICAE